MFKLHLQTSQEVRRCSIWAGISKAGLHSQTMSLFGLISSSVLWGQSCSPFPGQTELKLTLRVHNILYYKCMLIIFPKVLMQCNHLFKQLGEKINKPNIVISDLPYFLEKKPKPTTSYFSIPRNLGT